VIDIHSHLLPGVDDGSPSIEVSVRVLEKFAKQGLEVLVCTPHLDASRSASAPFAEYGAILETLRAAAPPEIELVQGWEIMLDAPGTDLTGAELTLGNSRALLVEFARGGVPRGGTAELRRIIRSGRTPILAHPERYFGCTLDMVREWREMGTVIQTDVSVLLGRGVPADFARAMLEHGFIDILASDNHGDDRSLAVARDWLLERGGEAQVDLLTHVNAERVLSNEDPVPVPPIPAQGLLGAIKRIFHR
jgi:protein-tyrosine phosphatase